MKRILLALAATLLWTHAFAQTQFPANTLWGNLTVNSGLPTTVPVPSCPTGALNYTPGTGFGCGSGGGGGGGVTSIAGMTGALTCGAGMICTGGAIASTGGGGGILSITSTGTTLLPTGGSTVNLEINLAKVNTWSGAQTFSAGASTNALTLSGITGSGFQCLHANNTGVVSGTGTDCGSGGGGAVNTVSNADGTLTIAPTAGNVVASLNLAHANTWTGAHTWTGGGANKILDVTSPNVGVNTGGNTIPGIFSVGWANTPSTANRVLFTVDDTANSVNGHWITSTLGVPGGLYTLGSAGVGGSGIVYTMNANVGNNTGSFPFFYQQWFNTTVASGTGGGVTGLFVEVITNGAWTPGATGNPGPNALQTLAEADTGGFVFGINPFARCKLVACAQVVGAEVDVDNQINGTSSKIGIQVIEGPTSTGTVTGDAPAYLAGSVNGLGFKAVLQLGLSNATAFPLTSTGAVIKAYAKSGGSTIADGIDLTGSGNTLTITGCTIKGPSGFCVNGVGHIAAGGLPTVTSCGASAAVSAGSTDTGGTATAQAASCVIVFATTYATTPNCVANDNTRASALTVAANPGAFQVTGLTAGDLFAWVCIGKSTL